MLNTFWMQRVTVYFAGDVNYERLPSVYRTALSRFAVDHEKTDRIHELEKLLSDRKLIDQAKGLLMQHKKCLNMRHINTCIVQ